MKVVVDAVFFQLASTGIARVWSSLLSIMALRGDVELILLDRGRCPEIKGVKRVAFPSYYINAHTATDSIRLDEVCRHLGADVFMSTYYTSVLTQPQVLMVYDMIPEVMGFDLSARAWREKDLAISFASRIGCISQQTADDLVRFHDHLAAERVSVIPCGVNGAVFHPAGTASVDAFRKANGLARDYFIFVGSREQHRGYKNADLFFRSLKHTEQGDLDVVCVGGEPTIEKIWLEGLPSDISITRLDLPDEELSIAYSGAAALIYPSLYEGFGMPVVEAMACGCPVVTTHCGSLREVAGDAALIIGGHDEKEMLDALDRVRQPEVRQRYIERGLAKARTYDWNKSEELLYDLLKRAVEDGRSAIQQQFFREWKRLRLLQASVDTAL